MRARPEVPPISPSRFRNRLLGGSQDRGWPARVQPVSFEDASALRVMLYCASNVGLGHLHRLTRIAAALRSELSQVDFLLVTDTQNLSAEEIDPDLAIVRLPEFEFREGSFKNLASGVSLSKGQLRDLRANLILAAAISFRPHAVLMDTNPHGKRNELEPLLKHLAGLRSPPARILQLRDIPFPSEETSRMTGEAGRVTQDFGLYDEILVAGDRGFFDLAKEYGWPEKVAERLKYIGFVLPDYGMAAGEGGSGARTGAGAAAPEASAPERKPVPVARWEGEGGAVDRGEARGPAARGPAAREVKTGAKERHIVAAMGGGWELETFGRKAVEAFIHLFPGGGRGTRFTLMTGPAAGREEAARLAAEVKGRPDIRVERYTREFDAMLRGCDLAILQAGSTAFQILETDIPILLYSRDFATREQAARAERLCRFPGIGRVEAVDLNADALSRRIGEALNAPRIRRTSGLSLDGARNAARLLADLLRPGGVTHR